MVKLKNWFVIVLSVSLSMMILSGCGSRMHKTSIVSKDLPPKPEVVQLHESTQETQSTMEDPMVANVETETTGVPFLDIPVEPPPQPVIRETPLKSIFATPQETPGLKSNHFTELVEPVNGMELNEEPMSQSEPIEIAKLTPSEQDIPIVPKREQEIFKLLEDVYFDYDRFGIPEKALPELTANAELLASKLAGETIVLQGHCDERGTESYNMILGKRRALAVKDFLVDLGVPDDNLVVMSFGKDKPFCTEQTVACWQENRRVHFEVQ